ncbi:hypothetical protein APW54_14230 [Staphylococcus aureus]|nr:hypothetical protein APW54_14230 [Staphylococcus aureus]
MNNHSIIKKIALSTGIYPCINFIKNAPTEDIKAIAMLLFTTVFIVIYTKAPDSSENNHKFNFSKPQL